MGNFISVIKSGIELEVTDDKAINAGLKYAFSTRNGGVSVGSLSSLNLGVNRPDTRENLIENYKIFCNAIDIDYNSVVLPKQIHSDIILNVTKSDRGKRLTLVSDLPDCDGLITTDKEVALGIFYADCTPVLLYDESVHCLCLVHCGWKGTVKGLAHRAVGKMINDYLCKKENIHAIIGPCIGVCHFEVGTDVMIEFKNTGLNKCIKKG
ncbi:MAG: polyphenol oxidase family protein, partial [Bacillota bacterium]|nr:polyphenol oxidase family protein [Bacillota bacterium]